VKLRLRSGANVDDALQSLTALAWNTHNAIPAGAPATQVRDHYVLWATRTEQQLHSFLRREDAAAIFANPQHRDICSMPPGSQLVPLVNTEVKAKADTFRELADQLRATRDRMRRAPGVPVVPDSNIFLHCQRPDNIAWKPALDDNARLLLPLRVIEELDMKKYGESKRLAQAARDLLPWIEGHFPKGDEGAVDIRTTATLEVLLAERPRYRPDDADEEILDVAHEVRHMTGSRVVLLTNDTGMRMRGLSEGLEVLRPPPTWLRQTNRGEGG
jgi:rRNA-processing protein FCF1